MTLGKVKCTNKVNTIARRNNGASRHSRRGILAASSPVAAFGLVLLAATGNAQTGPTADTKLSLISPLAAKPPGAHTDLIGRAIHVRDSREGTNEDPT